MKSDDYKSKAIPTYCPGCGNANVWLALRNAFERLNLEKEKVAMVFGIGCSGNLSNDFSTYVFHGLHGRSLPVAQGIKLANNDLTVLAIGGDGDGFGIGAGHFVHAARRNINITYIVSDNHRYALTTGQASPTTELGVKTKTTLRGNIEEPFNPLAIALSSGASFVARGYAGKNIKDLEDIFVQAIKHKGFSFVDVLQPCVTFNDINTYQFYNERVYNLDEKKYEVDDLQAALSKSYQWGEKIPLGVFYKENRPTYEEQIPALKDGSLVQKKPQININKLFQELS